MRLLALSHQEIKAAERAKGLPGLGSVSSVPPTLKLVSLPNFSAGDESTWFSGKFDQD